MLAKQGKIILKQKDLFEQQKRKKNREKRNKVKSYIKQHNILSTYADEINFAVHNNNENDLLFKTSSAEF